MLLTNSTKIVNDEKHVYCFAAYCGKVIEDSTNLGSLPADHMIFGQSIPIR